MITPLRISIPLLILTLCISCQSSQKTDIKYAKDSLLDVGMKAQDVLDSYTGPEKLVYQKLTGETAKHYGVDISHYQGNILQELGTHDSLHFIICKASQGTSYVDPMFQTNWNEIRSNGYVRGTYHFYDCSADPIKQANHFTSLLKGFDELDISPILDIEQGSMTKSVSGDQMVSDILRFLKQVETNLDRRPLIYTDHAFAQEYFKKSELANYDLWLAEYSGNRMPLIPNLWKQKGFAIWQKADNYNAHSTNMDLDFVQGSLLQLTQD